MKYEVKIMLEGSVIELFIKWLSPPTTERGKGSFEDRGLRENAPEEAKLAFKNYCEMEEEARKRGSKL
jgi:hypothetical protein